MQYYDTMCRVTTKLDRIYQSKYPMNKGTANALHTVGYEFEQNPSEP